MKRRVVFRRQANQDLAHAIEWYEKKRPGLGSQFLLAVEACIASASVEPERFAFIHKDLRKARVRRFPYSVYFAHEEEIIIVFAIFHAKRNPQDLPDPNQ